MPRVRSDELTGDCGGDEHQHLYDIGEKLISPIGAGLPLLSRLHLLKAKQVRNIFKLIFFTSSLNYLKF